MMTITTKTKNIPTEKTRLITAFFKTISQAMLAVESFNNYNELHQNKFKIFRHITILLGESTR